MVVFGEQAIQADPKQYAAMLMVAKGIAQTGQAGVGFDHDEREFAFASGFAGVALRPIQPP